MGVDPTMSESERVTALLEENLELSKQILASSERARRYILWGQVMSFVKVFLVVIPLVLGYWFLKPFLSSAFSTYRDLLGDATASGSGQPASPGLLDALKQLEQQGKVKGTDLKQLEQYLR